jgi:transcriptional regulator with XRE-family HTH domain
MYPPGLRLRQAREKLGLTYREVEKASFEIAMKRGRPDFILHISRLADIENRNVVPSLYKLYSVSVIYHLSVSEISGWYEAPFQQTFPDGASFPSPRTHLTEFLLPGPMPSSVHPDHLHDAAATGLLRELPPAVNGLPGPVEESRGRYRYGYIGLSDRRMMPVLRPGSMVLVDTSVHRIADADWKSEHERPMYFVELHGGYRCGWFQKVKSQLFMQPHTLSRCAPESWRTPEEAELVGQVIGVVTYLNEPWATAPESIHAGPQDWNETSL